MVLPISIFKFDAKNIPNVFKHIPDMFRRAQGLQNRVEGPGAGTKGFRCCLIISSTSTYAKTYTIIIQNKDSPETAQLSMHTHKKLQHTSLVLLG